MKGEPESERRNRATRKREWEKEGIEKIGKESDLIEDRGKWGNGNEGRRREGREKEGVKEGTREGGSERRKQRSKKWE